MVCASPPHRDMPHHRRHGPSPPRLGYPNAVRHPDRPRHRCSAATTVSARTQLLAHSLGFDHCDHNLSHVNRVFPATAPGNGPRTTASETVLDYTLRTCDRHCGIFRSITTGTHRGARASFAALPSYTTAVSGSPHKGWIIQCRYTSSIAHISAVAATMNVPSDEPEAYTRR